MATCWVKDCKSAWYSLATDISFISALCLHTHTLNIHTNRYWMRAHIQANTTTCSLQCKDTPAMLSMYRRKQGITMPERQNHSMESQYCCGELSVLFCTNSDINHIKVPEESRLLTEKFCLIKKTKTFRIRWCSSSFLYVKAAVVFINVTTADLTFSKKKWASKRAEHTLSGNSVVP